MSKASVQQRFASAFMTLVPQTPTKRVTVAELTRYLHVDRKTFYNYFDNIDSLMIWIYRDYLAKMLEDALFDDWEKEKPSADAFDPYPELPFYARRREKGLLCQGPYFKAMAYHWENLGATTPSCFRARATWTCSITSSRCSCRRFARM